MEAFAHALHHDRELGVLPGHVQQLGGPLPLLPQRLPLARVAPRQQQGPSRTLPEPPGEERGAAHVIHHIGQHTLRKLTQLPAAPHHARHVPPHGPDSPALSITSSPTTSESSPGCPSPRPATPFRPPPPSPPAPWRTAPSPTPGLVPRKNCPSNRSAPGGSSEYGRRNTSPSSPATAIASIPVSRCSTAPSAIAHGALTPRP